jgi:WD40 repeat protein
MKKYAVVMMLVGMGLVSSSSAEVVLPLIIETKEFFFEGSLIKFSPDSSKLIIGSNWGDIEIWDTVSGKKISNYREFSTHFEATSFFPDSSKIAFINWNSVDIRNADDGKILQNFPTNQREIDNLSLSADGSRIAAGDGDDSIYVWDIKSGKLVNTFDKQPKPMRFVKISQNGSKVLISGSDGNAILWHVQSGKPFFEFKNTTYAVLNPSGSRIITSGFLDSYRLFVLRNMLTGKKIAEFDIFNFSISFSLDGSKIIGLDNKNRINIWDSNSGKLIDIVGGSEEKTFIPFLNLHTQKIISINTHGEIDIWDLKNKMKNTIKDSSGEFYTADLSQDGAKLIYADWNHSVKVWDISTGSLAYDFGKFDDNVQFVQFSPDGSKILIGTSDDTVRLYDSSSLFPKK